jgi:ParB-like chromosome segregation protein Spo0J
VKLRQVSPDKVRIPEVRVTARFDPETWQQFQASMDKTGAIAPIICCEVEGELVLVDGLHRLIEAKRTGRTPIDVAVIPGNMVDVLTKNIFLDHLRGKTPVSEMVTVIEALANEYGLDSEAIAAKTGMTRDYVEKLQRISELTPYCRAALDEDRIKVGHAVELTRIKDPVRQETVLGQLELYHWGVKELHDFVDQLLAMLETKEEEPGGKTDRKPVKIKCTYCGELYDPSQLAAPVTCQVCSGIMFHAVAQARREAAADEDHHGEESGDPK